MLSRGADYAYAKAELSLPVQEQDVIARNGIFKNRHAGTRCFVIGNGPSLAAQDLGLLAGELTFAMSGFWKNPVVNQWQPKYYFFADAIYHDGSTEVDSFFASLRKRVTQATFFFPLLGRRTLESRELLPRDSTYYVAFLGQPLGFSVADSVELTRPVPFVYSTAQLALMTAIFMGCSPIYLLGLDHDWLTHRSLDRHFYPGQTIDNHKAATGQLDYAYDAEMQALWKLWQGYRELKAIAGARGIQILNATHGGFLDVFDRATYTDVVSSRD